MTKLELLAGARTADIGIEAIKHGADAVYIGAEKFGARAAAGNSIEDIARLCKFAHLFHARVYVTINTILKDEELPAARALVLQLYNAGADAILVQDMALLTMDLPPIALHASTQTDNCTAEKVKFLQDAGFSQVVLARECSLQQIRQIRAASDVALEAFVHGALCVSYSGRCYASQSITGRSANRGECAQICRLPFDLQDGYGHSYGKRHWLSLKDLNMSPRVEEMALAGISSFKIEGRLKSADYVKNTVAFYRQVLDKLIAKHPNEFARSSDGEVKLKFTPDLSRSFNRGFTEYFFSGRQSGISSVLTPKSTGKYIGIVDKVLTNRTFTIKGSESVNKQDGLCYFDDKGNFCGIKVNKCENNVVYAASDIAGLKPGCKIFKNSDAEFLNVLSKESAERRIGIDMVFKNGVLACSDGEIRIEERCNYKAEAAKTDQRENIRRALSKLGDSVYYAKSIDVEENCGFYPLSVLGELRRNAVEKMNEARLQSRPRQPRKSEKAGLVYPAEILDYSSNVSNKAAVSFYEDHGAKEIAPAFELQEAENAALMTCRYCLKYETGHCSRHSNPQPIVKKGRLDVPKFLVADSFILRLEFDCANCQMKVYKG